MFNIILIAALVAALIGGAELWKYKAVQADRAEQQVKKQQQELLDIRNENEQKQKVIDYADTLSKTRSEESRQQTARLAAIELRMVELLKRDPKVAVWASTDVPDAIRRLRRDGTLGGETAGSLPNPVGTVGANPDAANERQDKPGLVGGSQPVPGIAAKSQPGQAGRIENPDVAKPTPDAIAERISNLNKRVKR